MWLWASWPKGAAAFPAPHLSFRLKELEGNFKEEGGAEVKKAEHSQKSTGHVHFYFIRQNCVLAVPAAWEAGKCVFFPLG